MTDFDYGNFMREHVDWQEDFASVEESIRSAEEAWMTSGQKLLLDEWKEEIAHQQTAGELIHNIKEDYRRQTM